MYKLRHVVSRTVHRKMVETMEPDRPISAEENVLRLVDQLYRNLMGATLAREQGKLEETHKLIRATTEVYEEMHLALAAVDEKTRGELMPLVLEASAAEALLHANTYAATRTLHANRLAYGQAILSAQRIQNEAYQGRARSNFGAVLLYFEEYAEAASELQRARQLLRREELGSWVQTTTWLAQAYVGLGRRTDAISVLQETIGVFESRSYGRPQAITSHHIGAAMLLARLRVRNRERRMAKDILTRVKRSLEYLPGLHATPEYEQFQVLCSIGFIRYEFRQRRRPRLLQI